MTNTETAALIRRWVSQPRGLWGWPTDRCGYEQHVRFVKYRNEHWTLERQQVQRFDSFCLEYASALERQP
jgi:hypothetical protein